MGDSRERPAFTRQGRRPAGAHNPGLPGSTPGPGNRRAVRRMEDGDQDGWRLDSHRV